MKALENTAGQVIHPVVWADILAREHDGEDMLSGYEHAVGATVSSLTAVLFGNQITIKLGAYGARVLSSSDWQTEATASAAVIEFFSADKETPCAALALTGHLIDGSLAAYLGSVVPFEPLERLSGVSGMELRYIEHIAPAVMAALQPLSNLKLVTHRVCLGADWQASQSHDLCVASVAMAQSPESGLLSVAISKCVLDDKSEQAKRAHAVVYAAANAKVLEIGRTKVKVDVLVRATDLTLERIRSLSEGDVIGMDSAGLNGARAVARGQDMFTGQIGRSGGTYSIRVTETGKTASRAAVSALANHYESRAAK